MPQPNTGAENTVNYSVVHQEQQRTLKICSQVAVKQLLAGVLAGDSWSAGVVPGLRGCACSAAVFIRNYR